MSRYIVGIDLGTTNSALAYADLKVASGDAAAKIEVFEIDQLVAPGEVAPRRLLPSFLYLAAETEFPEGAAALPWDKKSARLTGVLARDHGGKTPARLVSSAKSWLSLEGVDRASAFLPLNAPEGAAKVSPIEASAAYLAHLRDAWNHRIAGKNADAKLEKQEILLTVPASFDAEARELTLRAAHAAGLKNITLLEEPQAAFYAWLDQQGETWRNHVRVGDLLLACDVGGGTTDLSLIGVSEQAGDLELTRLAVGEHILLGGDNMDLALAYAVAANLPGGMEALDLVQRTGLVHACRTAKETLCEQPNKPNAPVTVLGRGSKVIGGSIKTSLERDTLNSVLLDGFFPPCGLDEVPQRPRRMGLGEIGLPFASDPAITRHLARFLARQAEALAGKTGEAPALPTAVLFNGGVFQAGNLRDRITQALNRWSSRPVRVLESHDLNLAVARGAAYYGLVRQGKGIRIRGGVSRSYYIGVESAAPAVPGVPPQLKAICVVPMGMEEGTEADVPGPEFRLVVGEPAEFRFLSSTTRRDDAIGAILDRWAPDELIAATPLETLLSASADRSEGQGVPVRLHSRVTEVGTLELSCRSAKPAGEWKLEFNVREPAENA